VHVREYSLSPGYRHRRKSTNGGARISASWARDAIKLTNFELQLSARSNYAASTEKGQNALAVTAILPNYNHSQFLRVSIGSLLNQTRPANELIIIDDASTDDSVAVILDMVGESPNAKLVRNAKNIGVVASMNKGLANATGDIVFFAAADDIYYPRLFEVGAAILEAYPQAALFSALCDLIDASGVNKGRFLSPKPLTAPGYIDPSAAARELLRDDGWFMCNTAIYRRSALLAAGNFDEKLGPFTDGYMCRLLALQHGACFVPEILAGWRRLLTGHASSHAMKTDQMAEFVTLVTARMAASGDLFPTQYIYRWSRRYIFSGRRFALMHRSSAQAGLLHYVKRSFEALQILWMFLILRPWDIGTVLRRWAYAYWERRMPRPNRGSAK
jgi:glycosyltransferase involved in cell wall biosynthesis